METKVQPNTHQNGTHQNGFSEEPPPYFSSITQPGIQLASTITDVNSYPTQPNSKVKLPLYNYTASAAADISTTIQPASSVTVVTSQPRFNYGRPSSFTQSASGTAGQLFGASVFLVVLCAVFGSPLTLICFVPAIYLSQKVYHNNIPSPIIHVCTLLILIGERVW